MFKMLRAINACFDFRNFKTNLSKYKNRSSKLHFEFLEDRVTPTVTLFDHNTNTQIGVPFTGAAAIQNAIFDIEFNQPSGTTYRLNVNNDESYSDFIVSPNSKLNNLRIVRDPVASGAPQVVSIGTGNNAWIRSTGVLIDGIDFANDPFNSNLAGLRIDGNNATINNANISGFTTVNTAGIRVVGGRSGTTVQNSTIANNYIGIGFTTGAGTNNTLIQNNYIQSNLTSGIELPAATTGTGTTIRFNEFSSNTSWNVNNLSTSSLDASLNRWGTSGGLLTSESAVATTINGVSLVDYSPFLYYGDANGSTAGFQQDTSRLTVTTQGPQTGSTGRIQEAVNNVQDGTLTGGNRLLTVLAGTYAENVAVDRSLKLLGAQAGVNANTRFAAFTGGPANPKANPAVETIITPYYNDPSNPNPNANDLLRTLANNITVDGLVIDGNNTAIAGSSAVQIGGIDIDARRGITTVDANGNYVVTSGLVIQNNILQNLAERGINLDNDGNAPAVKHQVTGNVIRSFGEAGIILFWNAFTDITNNTIDAKTSASGIDLQNFFAGSQSMTWSGNSITVGQDGTGINVNLFYDNGSTLNITSNTINAATGVTAGTGATSPDDLTWGINLWSFDNTTTTNLTNNIIGSSGGQFARGVNLWNISSPASVTVSGGTIGNARVGINMDATDPYYAGADGIATISNVAITGGDVGIRVRSRVLPYTPLGNNPPPVNGNPNGNVRLNISGGSISGATTGILVEDSNVDTYTASVQLLGGTTISGATTGLRVDGLETAIVGNTLANTIFSGVTGNYITLNNGALGTPATQVDGTGVSYNGILGNAASLAQGFAIEDKVSHATDASGLGYVRITSAKVYVTASSGSVQRGVNVASVNDTLHVGAGTYLEDVTINTTGLQLLGAGAGSSTISGAIGGSGTTIQIGASNVLVDGFTITRDGNTAAQWNLALNTAGVAIQGLAITGVEIRNNNFTGNRTAIDINNSGGHSIHNNVIDFNRTGLLFRNQTDNISVYENFITNNWTVGVLFLDGSGGTNSPVQQALGSTFFNNNISGNWYGQIVDRQSGGSLPTPGTNIKDFSGNWFGSINPVISTANSAEPGYAALVPVAFGGTSTPPGGQPDVLGPASANFDISPYLNVGTDTSPGTYGFQGDFSTLWVTPQLAQTGSSSRIQEAYNLVVDPVGPANGLVRILGGSYAGNVNANLLKNVDLSPGTSPAQVTINGNFTLNSGVTLIMEINGTTPGSGYDQFAVTGNVTLGNASLSVTRDVNAYIPNGTAIRLIDNQGSNSITNTFSGVPEGFVFTLNNVPFTSSYVAGTGNDFALTVTAPSDVWVNDNWFITTDVGATGLSPGDIVATTGGDIQPASGKIFGYNAFSSIQSGIDAVAINGTVRVVTGVYLETPNVYKGLTILGPQSGVDPRSTGIISRPGGEAIVRPAASQAAPLDGNLFTVTADNVSISGLTLDGNNSAVLVVDGPESNGIFLNLARGIANGTDTSGWTPINNLFVSNNIVKNFARFGVGLNNGSVASGGNTITTNVIDNMQGYFFPSSPSSFAGRQGVFLGNNAYASVVNNNITRTERGIHMQGHYLASPGGAPAITGNVITSATSGIYYNSQYQNASAATISNNTLGSIDANNAGMLIFTVQDTVAPTISNNIISSGALFGYVVWMTPTTGGLTISGGSVTGATNTAVLLTNDITGYVGAPFATQPSRLNLNGVTLTNNATAIIAYDNPANANPTSNLQLSLNGVNVNGATTGISLIGLDISLIGNTLANTVFTGVTGNYLSLSAGALAGTEVNGTGVSFNGVLGSGASVAQGFAIEDKMQHSIDGSSVGFVRVQSGQVYVTPNSFAAALGTTTPSIQRGVNAALSGDTVNIQTGSYPGNVTVNTSLTLNAVSNATINPSSGNALTVTAGTTTITGTFTTGAFPTVVQSGASIQGTGTITGPVSINAGAFIAPGASPGIFNTGNLNLAGTYTAEANGVASPVAGIDYDQINVTGTVTLSGILTLNVTSGAAVNMYGSMTLINNDGVDPVTGAFSNYANGQTFTLGGATWVIFYNGGDGNDVTMIRVPLLTPVVTYAEDTLWSALPNGTFIADADFTAPGNQSAVKGYDAFTTFQAAINAVANPGTVIVNAGTYVEDVTINKAISVLGPNRGINPNTGSRVAEAIIRPATSNPDPFSITSIPVIYVTTSNVSIDGLTVDGDNTSITSGVLVNGVDVDSIEGIASYEGVGNITVQNNIVRNLSYTGLDFYNYNNSGAATSNNYLRNNRFTDIGHIPYGFGIGVLIYNNFYAEVTGNVMTGVRVGVQTGNFYQANPGSTALISNNDITTARIGIWHNLTYQNASPFTISNNTVVGAPEAGSTRWAGIFLSTIQDSVGVTVSNNTITATAATASNKAGYSVWNNPTTNTVTISGGTVTGAAYGVWLNNYGSYTSNGSSTILNINNVNIQNSGIAGVFVQDDPLNTNNSTVAANITGGTINGTGSAAGVMVSGSDASASVNALVISNVAMGMDVSAGGLTVGSGNSISSSVTGLAVSGATSSIAGNTLNNLSFSGISGNYVTLSNNALDNLEINGTAAVYNGVLGSAATVAQGFAIEDKMQHAIDGSSVGFIRVRTGQVYVTPNSFAAALGTSAPSIQRGVDAAISGDTVQVQAGLYDEAVNVNKSVTIQGYSGSILTRTSGLQQALITVTAPTVTIRDMELRVNRPFATAGIYASDSLADFSNLQLLNNTITSYGTGSNFVTPDGNTSAPGIALLSFVTANLPVTIQGNTINAGPDPDGPGSLTASVFSRGIWLRRVVGSIGGTLPAQGNSIFSTTQDLLIRFNDPSTTLVQNNTFQGAGMDISETNPGTGVINILNNQFVPVSPLFNQSLSIKFNYDANRTINVDGNTFSGHGNIGIISGASKNVNVTNNAFTPASGASNFTHILMSSSYPTSGTPTAITGNSITVTGNSFNSAAGSSGRGIDFQNGNNTGSTFGAITVGGAGALANLFASGLTQFLRLSPTPLAPLFSPASNPSSAPFTVNIDGSQNQFDVGSGLQLPAVMTLAQRFSLEDKIIHKVDEGSVGFVTVVPGQVFVTVNSFLAPYTTTASIQRGVDAAGTGDTINLQSGTYTESAVQSNPLGASYPSAAVLVNKSVTILGDGVVNVTTPNTPTIASPGMGVFDISASNVTLSNLNINVQKPHALTGIQAFDNFNGLTVNNVTVRSFGSGGNYNYPSMPGTSNPAHGILAVNTAGGSPIVTITNSSVLPDNNLTPTSFFGRAVYLVGVVANVSGVLGTHAFAGTGQDFQLTDAAPGTSTISGMIFPGNGANIFGSQAGAIVNITGNSFQQPGSPAIPEKSLAITESLLGTVNVINNLFSNVQSNRYAVVSGASRNVTLQNNTFSAGATATNFTYVLVSSSYSTSGVPNAITNQSIAFYGNTFNGGSSVTGRAIDFQNGNDAGPGTWGTIDIGGTTVPQRNSFGANLGEFLRLSPATITTPTVTTNPNLQPFRPNLSVSNNLFDVGSGLQLPVSFTPAQNFAMENKVYHKIDNGTVGLVLWTPNSIYVTPASSPTATDNDYTRINNAIYAASNGYSINLLGTFNWAETNAAASWALGSDGVSSTYDDFAILAPANLNNITLTAPLGSGTATVAGPGDLATYDLEAFIFFVTGNSPGAGYANSTNSGWTISNLELFDFDLTIGYFLDGSSQNVTAFSNTTIQNNTIRVPVDLNATVAPIDASQNIALHLSVGVNQMITGNTILFPGSGVSDSANSKFSTRVGLQSNTTGGALYEGLQITNNQLTVTGAQSADPEVILGIWENGHNHLANLTISGNSFTNTNPGNDPTLNLQRAFRVTSHSSGSTTVTYANNTVTGANIGFQWLAGQNFAGNQPVVLTGNTISNTNTGILVQSNGSANINNSVASNTLNNAGAMAGVGTGIRIAAGSSASINGNNATISGFATGIDVFGSATVNNNTIYSNTTGIRINAGANGSVTNNEFRNTLAFVGNSTDLRIEAGAGVISAISGNNFGGGSGSPASFANANGYFIDNRSTQNFDLTAAGNTWQRSNGSSWAALNTGTLADNFRIEDRLYHTLDNTASGRITLVAGTRYVSTPGSGVSDETIQRAITAADNGDTIHVEAGTYAENVIVDKSVTIWGAGQGLTNVVPAFIGANMGGGSLAAGHSTLFLVRSNNVTIRNLTADGNNPLLTSGVVVNGSDIDARNGIVTDHATIFTPITGLTVQNVTVQNVWLRGIQSSTDFGSFNFTNNIVQNVAGNPAGSIAIFNFGGGGTISGNQVSQASDGISSNWSTGTTVAGNTVSNSDSGIHTDNAGGYGGPSVPDVISGNTVQNGTSNSYGIFVFVPYNAVQVNNNIVNNVDVGLAAFGGGGGSALFSNNQVDLASRTGSLGAWASTTIFGFGSAPVTATFTGNTIVNAATLLLVEQENATNAVPPPAGPVTASVILNGNTFDNTATSLLNTIGVDINGGTVTMGAGNQIIGTATGLRASAAVTPVVFSGNTLNNLVFSGISGNYVSLTSNALDNIEVDGTGVTYNGVLGSSALLAQGFAIEDKIQHAVDAATLGFVRVKSGNVYVTPNSFAASEGTTTPQIQRGVDAGVANDTVWVQSGLYDNDVIVNKSGMSLIGEGYATTTIRGVIGNGQPDTVLIVSPNVTLAGFTITRSGNTVGLWTNPGLNNQGVSIVSTGALIRDNLITQNRNGIYIDGGAGNVTIRNNIVTDNRTGIHTFQVNGLTVTENEISNNWTMGLLFRNENLTNPTTGPIDVFNNAIFGNFYAGIERRWNNTSVQINASGNWFGTNTPVYVSNNAGNAGEPGYSSTPLSIPVALGGTGAPVPGAPDILESTGFGTQVDFTPFLWTGIDTNSGAYPSTNGFQGDFSNLAVTTQGAQSQLISRVQEGYNLLAASGGIIHVLSGSYAGNVATGVKSATFDLGSPITTTQITINGSLTLTPSVTVNFNLSGPNVSTPVGGVDYDQLVTTGAADLGGATFNITRTMGYFPIIGSNFALVRSTAPKSGSFNYGGSVAENAIIAVDGVTFLVNYNLGSGPYDLNLKVTIPNNIVYVWNGWTGQTLGDYYQTSPLVNTLAAPPGGYVTFSGSPVSFGYNAYATIQDAINAVPSGGIIRIYMGTYSQDVNVPNGKNNLQWLAWGAAGSRIINGVAGGASATITLNGNGTSILGNSNSDNFIVNQTAADNLAGIRTGAGSAGSSVSYVNVSGTFNSTAFSGIDISNGSWITYSNGTINNYRTGIKVNTGGGTAANPVDIQNAVINGSGWASLTVSPAGVDVAPGGYVRLTNNNTISGNRWGVRVLGGTAMLQGNNLSGNSHTGASAAGLFVANGGLVDAGQVIDGTQANYTGLGISTGNNLFNSGYAMGGAQAIVNLNADFIGAPVGTGNVTTGTHVSARNNNFGTSIYGNIERVVNHSIDNNFQGYVDYRNAIGAVAPLQEGTTTYYALNATGEVTTQRSMIRGIQFVIDSPVMLGSGAVTLTRANHSATATIAQQNFNNTSYTLYYGGPLPTGSVPLTVTSSVSGTTGRTTITVTFTASSFVEAGGSLVDGFYARSMNASLVDLLFTGSGTNLSNSNLTPALTDFHRLFGDVNGDRINNAFDDTRFNDAYNVTDSLWSIYFDRNNSGTAFQDSFDQSSYNVRRNRRLF